MTQKTVSITRERIGKPPQRYTERFVEDDGRRLKSRTVLTEADGLVLAARWREQWLLSKNASIGTIEKYHFYGEFFAILKVSDRRGRLAGYYCDIAAPLQNSDGAYFLTDLILDRWIHPDGRFVVLDRKEFDNAVKENLLTPVLRRKALGVLAWLRDEISAGRFPHVYID